MVRKSKGALTVKLYSMRLLDLSQSIGESIINEAARGGGVVVAEDVKEISELTLDIPDAGDVVIETWGDKTRYMTVIKQKKAAVGDAVHYTLFVSDNVNSGMKNVTWHKDYHFRYMKRIA